MRFHYEYISHKPYLTYCTCANAAKDCWEPPCTSRYQSWQDLRHWKPQPWFLPLGWANCWLPVKKVPKRISFWSYKWCLAPSVLKSERLNDSKNSQRLQSIHFWSRTTHRKNHIVLLRFWTLTIADHIEIRDGMAPWPAGTGNHHFGEILTCISRLTVGPPTWKNHEKNL